MTNSGGRFIARELHELAEPDSGASQRRTGDGPIDRVARPANPEFPLVWKLDVASLCALAEVSEQPLFDWLKAHGRPME